MTTIHLPNMLSGAWEVIIRKGGIMLEPTKVTVEITMTDEITGRTSKTRYGLHEALYYVNGAAEFHADYMDYIYGNLEHAVRVHLKKEGAKP